MGLVPVLYETVPTSFMDFLDAPSLSNSVDSPPLSDTEVPSLRFTVLLEVSLSVVVLVVPSVLLSFSISYLINNTVNVIHVAQFLTIRLVHKIIFCFCKSLFIYLSSKT